MTAPLTRWVPRPVPWIAAIEARTQEIYNAAEANDRDVPEAREVITTLQEEGHDLQALKDLLLETFVTWGSVDSRLLEEYVEVPR